MSVVVFAAVSVIMLFHQYFVKIVSFVLSCDFIIQPPPSPSFCVNAEICNVPKKKKEIS